MFAFCTLSNGGGNIIVVHSQYFVPCVVTENISLSTKATFTQSSSVCKEVFYLMCHRAVNRSLSSSVETLLEVVIAAFTQMQRGVTEPVF